MSSNADEKPDSQLLDLIKSNPGFVVSLPGTGLESTANLSNVEHMNIEDDLVERIEKLAEVKKSTTYYMCGSCFFLSCSAREVFVLFNSFHAQVTECQ